MGSYLGQNFLTDSKIRKYIADKVSSLYQKIGCESLIEIGPGKGAITKLINQISDNFFVIEKDHSLKENLSKISNDKGGILNYIEGDVLEIDVEKILNERKLKVERTLVVGNLPYYITSPILRKFFSGSNSKFPGGIFMLQNEVGEKIKSDAKKKSYLRWLLNYGYDVKYLKMVPAKAFSPVPKVKSCLIELRIKNPVASYGASGKCGIEWDKLIEFLDLYSGFSRKTLGAIEKIVDKRLLKSAKADDKQLINRRRTIDKNGSKLRDKQLINSGLTNEKHLFKILDSLKKKRLEELSWEDLEKIIN